MTRQGRRGDPRGRMPVRLAAALRLFPPACLLFSVSMPLPWSAAATMQVPPPPEGAPTTPALQRLLDQREVAAVASGYAFAEGPLWHPLGYLLFADSGRSRIHRWVPGAEVTPFRDPSHAATALALDASGRLLAAEHELRRVSRTERDGTVVTIADRFEGRRLNSPNDLVVSREGSVFFTDPPYGLPGMKEGKELDFQGVYRLDSDGRLRALVRDLPRPNGVGLAPDGSLLYVTDSERAELRAYRLKADGGVDSGRVLAELKPWKPGVQGVPDGLSVDANGRLFVSGPGGVWVIDPRGGRLGVIPTPEPPSDCVFGGRDGRTLYITARTRVYAIRMKVRGAR